MISTSEQSSELVTNNYETDAQTASDFVVEDSSGKSKKVSNEEHPSDRKSPTSRRD